MAITFPEGQTPSKATLIINEWGENDRGPGQRFWESLGPTDPGMRTKLRTISQDQFPLKAIQVSISVTFSDDRGWETYGTLLKDAVEKQDPSAILDLTNSPDEAFLIAQTLGPLGYRVFLGHSEITPGREQEFSDKARTMRNAFLKATGVELEENGAVYTNPSPSSDPSAIHATDLIRRLFESARDAQKQATGSKIVKLPLIAIRSDTWTLFEQKPAA